MQENSTLFYAPSKSTLLARTSRRGQSSPVKLRGGLWPMGKRRQMNVSFFCCCYFLERNASSLLRLFPPLFFQCKGKKTRLQGIGFRHFSERFFFVCVLPSLESFASGRNSWNWRAEKQKKKWVVKIKSGAHLGERDPGEGGSGRWKSPNPHSADTRMRNFMPPISVARKCERENGEKKIRRWNYLRCIGRQADVGGAVISRA